MSEKLSSDMVSVNRCSLELLQQAWENCMDTLDKHKAEIERLKRLVCELADACEGYPDLHKRAWEATKNE